jgi:hypothetical protein
VADQIGGVTSAINSAVNSDSANIVGSIAGGSIEETLRDIQSVANATNNAVDAYSNTPHALVGVDPRAIAQTFEPVQRQ